MRDLAKKFWEMKAEMDGKKRVHTKRIQRFKVICDEFAQLTNQRPCIKKGCDWDCVDRLEWYFRTN